MRRVFINEVWNQRKLDLMLETHTPDFVWHGPTGPFRGAEGNRQGVVTMYTTSFPDVHFTIDDEIIAKEKEVTRWATTATHKGEFLGIAPTGKKVTGSGISIARVSGGKIAEERVTAVNPCTLQQIGGVALTKGAPP